MLEFLQLVPLGCLGFTAYLALILYSGEEAFSIYVAGSVCLTSAKFGQGLISPKLSFPITKPSRRNE
jgi:hypothetical protein